MSFLVPILKIREQRREASSPYFSWAQYIIPVLCYKKLNSQNNSGMVGMIYDFSYSSYFSLSRIHLIHIVNLIQNTVLLIHTANLEF